MEGILTVDECEAGERALAELVSAPWASALVQRTRGILDRFRAGAASVDSAKAALFEVRVAWAICRAGRRADYEFPAGIGNSTIDFRVHGQPEWLIECCSLGQSNALRSATFDTGLVSGYTLRSDAADPRQSEEGEMIKAQERILTKVAAEGVPTKFPEVADQIHALFVDIRSCAGTSGEGDRYDQLAWGPGAVRNPDLVLYWEHDGRLRPIRGLFEPENPLQASRYLRERIHFLVLVCEKTFGADDLARWCVWFYNPALVPDDEACHRIAGRGPFLRLAE